MKEVILEDFNRRVAKNIDTDFFLLATALDPRWKDLKMIRRSERDLVFTRLQREMSILTKPNLAAEEVSSKPKKRRLLDFDESDDEESNEEDPMEAELKRF